MSKRAFIVRPFGTPRRDRFRRPSKRGYSAGDSRSQAAVLEGGTTPPIFEQGNIREDMFRELVATDLVIADLSIHYANVFYELGIRHGLRPNASVAGSFQRARR
jgi:hypothetical protein